MDRVLVTSSSVAAVGYDHETLTLEVEFNDSGIYHYLDVPARHFGVLTGGKISVGRYLNAEIKPHYRCEKVT